MTEQFDLASKLIQHKNKISDDRSNFEYVWEQISEFVLPNRQDFLRDRAKGDRRDERVFDTTAIQANETLAAALHSGMMNPASRWFNLMPSDPRLAESREVKEYVEEVLRIMYATFDSAEGNFYQQTHEMLLDLVAYGTSIIYIEENFENGITFNTRHLSEIYIQENSRGVVDTIFRDFKFTARQAAQEWGEENLSDGLKQALKMNSSEKFDFIHAVMPRKDAQRIDPNSIDGIADDREFIGFYVSVKDKSVISTKGFYEMPYVVIRWEKLVGESYGRSPAWNSLSDIRMINVMSETVIRAAQKQVDPPLLMADDGVLMPLRTHPSGVNIGGVSQDGRPLIQPLQAGGNLQVGLEMMEQRREAIRRAYFVDQFIPKEGTPVTATEFLQNQDNALRLTGPQLKRLQAEGVSRIIDRTFAIRQRQNIFPEPPEALQGVNLEIDYISPVVKNQRASELLGMNRAIDSAAALIPYQPDILDNVDGDAYLRRALETAGVPITDIKSEDDVTEIRQARAEQQAAQQQAALASQRANDIANLKKAGVDVGV